MASSFPSSPRPAGHEYDFDDNDSFDGDEDKVYNEQASDEGNLDDVLGVVSAWDFSELHLSHNIHCWHRITSSISNSSSFPVFVWIFVCFYNYNFPRYAVRNVDKMSSAHSKESENDCFHTVPTKVFRGKAEMRSGSTQGKVDRRQAVNPSNNNVWTSQLPECQKDSKSLSRFHLFSKILC